MSKRKKKKKIAKLASADAGFNLNDKG